VLRESRALLSSSAEAAPRDYMLAAIATPQGIAPLPQICVQLTELAAQDTIDGAQYARLIQSDAVLAGEIMRVANSPALRPRTPIVSLQQAVSWLGIAEVRSIAMAIMLRGEVFVAPGHEPESEELWREAWFAALWAKEVARLRRKHVEGAFLSALMHRTGAALALKILSRFEIEQRTALDARSFGELVVEFDPAFSRMLMEGWRIAPEIQLGATDWREYSGSSQADLAATVHAAHVLAAHTLHPQLMAEDIALDCPVWEFLGVFIDQRKALLAMRDQIKTTAGL
jgi:HD-like signal output (HDOD) protein